MNSPLVSFGTGGDRLGRAAVVVCGVMMITRGRMFKCRHRRMGWRPVPEEELLVLISAGAADLDRLSAPRPRSPTPRR